MCVFVVGAVRHINKPKKKKIMTGHARNYFWVLLEWRKKKRKKKKPASDVWRLEVGGEMVSEPTCQQS